MSRVPSSSKYKISNPQPYAQQDLRTAYNTDNGPYPSFPPSQPTSQQSQQPQQAPQSYRSTGPVSRPNAGETSRNVTPMSGAPGGGVPPVSPARPARSRMREAPQPPSAPRGLPSGPAAPPAAAPASRRNLLPPVQTRRPSGRSGVGDSAYDLAPSPISPVSPYGDSAQNPNTTTSQFADPFAADRSQRSELRAQASAAAQQAQQPFGAGGPGSDKLRNVVGAFMSAGRQREEAPPVRRPGKSEARQRARSKPREEAWEDEGAEGGKFGEIDGVLRNIRKDWPFVMESDFSASTLALSLLSETPSTSLPAHPPLASFLRLHESLSSGLQAAVQAHSKSFAASLPAHKNFLDILEKAQEQVRKSKADLKEARDGFAGKGKSELAGIRARERTVRDMLKILDTIDHLKQVPDQLESLIGDKRFLQAALILVRSLKTINKPELMEIGALSDLRAYMVSQETTLTDILVEELHNHIYLKTFYSDSRWKPYTPGQQVLPVIEPQDGDLPLSLTFSPNPTIITSPALNSVAATGNATPGPGPSSRFSRYLAQLTTKPSTDPMLLYDGDTVPPPTPSLPQMTHTRNGGGSNGGAGGAGGVGMTQSGSSTSLSSIIGAGGMGPVNGPGTDLGNPEADSYAYIETLLEALAVMGRLGQALDMVAQRVPAEIRSLVESTLDEVEDRSEQRREEVDLSTRPRSTLDPDLPSSSSSSRPDSSLRRKSLFGPAETLRIEVSLGATGPPQHAALLRDLFWTLYSKLAAVLEGHRAMYEVSRWISSRRDFKDSTTTKASSSLNIPVLEMWKPVQQEVRTLLSNYLTDDRPGSTLDRHPIQSVNEVLRDPRVSRDKSKPMFRFSDSDSRAIQNEIKPIDDSLQTALRTTVPGLVQMQSEQPMSVSLLPETDDRFSSSPGRYRTLIPPNAFNVTTLFQPTLSFIQRATAIVPPGFEEETEGFSTVLEEFVVKVFLPQLDERVTASFQQAVSGYDAFQVERALLVEVKQPPLKSSVRVMALIHSLCVMLQTTPFHRENYSRLIVGVIVQYYQQCSARFKDLASLPATPENPSDRPLALSAVWAQRDVVIKCLSELRAVPDTDHAGIAAISHKEIKLEIELLGDKPLVESRLINSHRKLEALGNLSQSLRWFIDGLLDLQAVAEEPFSPDGEQPDLDVLAVAPPLAADSDEPRLPLTRAMAQRFQAIILTYEQLAEMVLNTIRLEIRCRMICNLGASLRKGDFRLESEALEPDSDVLDLNANLNETEELAERTIATEDRSFIFRGLGQLGDYCFITLASKHMKVVNAAGVRKIKRNILSLQQTLRGIAPASGEGVLARAVAYWDLFERGPKEMLEDLKNMEGKPPYSFEDYNAMLNLQFKLNKDDAPSSELNTYLIDLHALSMSIEGWELGGE
ncbi:hypothetical protein IAT38_005667 [Cryptococcus sp. DSM 104549]